MAAVSRSSHDRSVPLTRVLVVEDNGRFRNFVCSKLRQRNDFKIVGEAVDGLEAVGKAGELRPDLILMDIGLPGLNGIDAARRILELLPECKIIFLTQEDSAKVVEAALSLGARGYVIKARAESELLLAIDTARQDGQFVSSAVAKQDRSETAESTAVNRVSGTGPFKTSLLPPKSKKARVIGHQADFHSDDSFRLATFTLFVEKALKAGGVAIVILTDQHRKTLFQGLWSRGLDMAEAVKKGRYIAFDVREYLAKFMTNNQVDPERFFRTISDTMAEIKARHGDVPISACGEGTATLWAQGNGDAAVQLELLWDEAGRMYDIDILCGYLLQGALSEGDRDIYEKICAVHSAVCSY